MEKLHVAREVADDVVSEGDGADELRVIAAAGRVAHNVELRHQTHAPAGGQLHCERRDEAALDATVPKLVLIRWELHVGHQAKRGVAAVVAPEVPLHAHQKIVETALLRDAGGGIGGVNVSVRLHDELRIHVVQQANLEVDGRDVPGADNGAVAGRVVLVVSVGGEVHLDLEMAGVHGVGRLGFVGPVGGHLAHERGRRGVEEVKLRFIRRGIGGERSGGGDEQAGGDEGAVQGERED